MSNNQTDDTTEFNALLSEARTRIDQRLAEWLEPRVVAASQISGEVALAAEAARDLALRGGKRMRAALVAAGFEAMQSSNASSSSEDWRAVCEPAMMAVELLQVYLLIHDDWMDDDAMRRGGPSVHVVLREKLGSKALGDAAAILAGDLASGYAQEALLETKVSDPNRLLRAARAYARIQVDVVTGQLAEMRGLCRSPPPPKKESGVPEAPGSVPSVETIHALKTASYTVTGPLLLGALLAGADDARCAELERFGRPLGIAFQLRDDLLGVFGDPSATGKPIWNDIRQGKRTALISEMRGDARAEALFARTFGVPSATDQDLEAVVRLMDASGAKSRVEARVRELCDEARAVLHAMGSGAAGRTGAGALSPRGHRWLRGAASALGERAS